MPALTARIARTARTTSPLPLKAFQAATSATAAPVLHRAPAAPARFGYSALRIQRYFVPPL